jgi:hypothetical protein
LASLYDSLSNYDYPFDHSEGHLTIARFTFAERPFNTDLVRTFYLSEAFLEKFYHLYYRILGRLVQIAEAVETCIGLKSLPELPKSEL